MSPSKHNGVDHLMSRWAELLKIRHQVRGLGSVTFRMIYCPLLDSSPGDAPQQSYEADFEYGDDPNSMLEAFIRNIEANLDGLEQALKDRGVVVSRPP